MIASCDTGSWHFEAAEDDGSRKAVHQRCSLFGDVETETGACGCRVAIAGSARR
jgi:hypothetical protein